MEQRRTDAAHIEDIFMRLWMVTQEQLAAIKLQIREQHKPHGITDNAAPRTATHYHARGPRL